MYVYIYMQEDGRRAKKKYAMMRMKDMDWLESRWSVVSSIYILRRIHRLPLWLCVLVMSGTQAAHPYIYIKLCCLERWTPTYAMLESIEVWGIRYVVYAFIKP